jgi:hypothetical protein
LHGLFWQNAMLRAQGKQAGIRSAEMRAFWEAGSWVEGREVPARRILNSEKLATTSATALTSITR